MKHWKTYIDDNFPKEKIKDNLSDYLDPKSEFNVTSKGKNPDITWDYLKGEGNNLNTNLTTSPSPTTTSSASSSSSSPTATSSSSSSSTTTTSSSPSPTATSSSSASSPSSTTTTSSASSPSPSPSSSASPSPSPTATSSSSSPSPTATSSSSSQPSTTSFDKDETYYTKQKTITTKKDANLEEEYTYDDFEDFPEKQQLLEEPKTISSNTTENLDVQENIQKVIKEKYNYTETINYYEQVKEILVAKNKPDVIDTLSATSENILESLKKIPAPLQKVEQINLNDVDINKVLNNSTVEKDIDVNKIFNNPTVAQNDNANAALFKQNEELFATLNKSPDIEINIQEQRSPDIQENIPVNDKQNETLHENITRAFEHIDKNQEKAAEIQKTVVMENEKITTKLKSILISLKNLEWWSNNIYWISMGTLALWWFSWFIYVL